MNRHLVITVVALAVVAVVTAGCGGGEKTTGTGKSDTTKTQGGGTDGSTAAAKDLFKSSCGGCHTLGTAGTSGTTGPNLDDSKPDESKVKDKIKKGGNGMPANLLTGKDADSVAKYVSEVAGK